MFIKENDLMYTCKNMDDVRKHKIAYISNLNMCIYRFLLK